MLGRGMLTAGGADGRMAGEGEEGRIIWGGAGRENDGDDGGAYECGMGTTGAGRGTTGITGVGRGTIGMARGIIGVTGWLYMGAGVG
jgi:hypothetical protein